MKEKRNDHDYPEKKSIGKKVYQYIYQQKRNIQNSKIVQDLQEWDFLLSARI